MMKKERPVRHMPIAILVGVAGSSPRLSSCFQNHTSGKVRMSTQPGLMELEMMPLTFQSVLLFAQ